jgi:hypothetical protein
MNGSSNAKQRGLSLLRAARRADLKRLMRASMFNLPIFRWRNELVDGSALETQSMRDELFNHEPNLWSYFVEGAPLLLVETIKSVRKLVNGSPGLLDFLTS